MKKLGFAAGTRWDLVAEPDDWRFETEPVGAVRARSGPVDLLLFFSRTAGDLDVIDPLAERIRPAGALWIAWPRKAAGHVSDITENLIREVVLPRGLVDVKVAALDADWSGLKIVWRREHR